MPVKAHFNSIFASQFSNLYTSITGCLNPNTPNVRNQMTQAKTQMWNRRIPSPSQTSCRRSTENLRKFKSAHSISIPLRTKSTQCTCVHSPFLTNP
ncbi:unnamed protein product [Haemonchus placei]|uniref:Ovule protein n=1 Tax=Haemonchus placei TaxID=6290 RepID=A0A0N4VVY0_HAEPC|nr:unnamed protein product [Haemonchus placei]